MTSTATPTATTSNFPPTSNLFIDTRMPLPKSEFPMTFPGVVTIDNRPKTLIIDIDGLICEHQPLRQNTREISQLKLLAGTPEKFEEWDKKGYRIILITGRRESMRKATEKQLANCGIFYDQLIMGIGGGARVLINDEKPDGTKTAFAINVPRNTGLKDIDI